MASKQCIAHFIPRQNGHCISAIDHPFYPSHLFDMFLVNYYW